MHPKITNLDYDTEIEYYETMNYWYEQGLMHERIKNILAPITPFLKDTVRILDVGCGIGTFAIEISKLVNAEIIGVDYSRTAISFSQNNLRNFSANSKTTFQLIDNVENLSCFTDNYFDIIVAADIIEHLYNPKLFLKELYRILKYDGKIVFETPNIAFRQSEYITALKIKYKSSNTEILTKPLSSTKDYSQQFHVHLYNTHDFIDDLTETNLEIITLKYTSWCNEYKGLDRFFSVIMNHHAIQNTLSEETGADIICLATKTKLFSAEKNDVYRTSNDSLYISLANELDILITDILMNRENVLNEEFKFLAAKNENLINKIKLILIPKNHESQGNEFWLFNIASDKIRSRYLRNIHRNGSWNISPSSARISCDSLISSEPNSYLEFEIFGNELYLDVLKHPWSGRIKLIIDNANTIEYDLYSINSLIETIIIPLK
jgi:ubiquinone/menaquinone biosynthesis C-methylase UbiE